MRRRWVVVGVVRWVEVGRSVAACKVERAVRAATRVAEVAMAG